MNAQAKTKRTPAISAEITLESPERGTSPNNKLTVTFADGRIINVMVSDLPQEIRAMALMHGLKQKLVDAAAISRNPDTGRSATIEDKYAAVRAVADQLFAGHWNAVRNGTGGTGTGGLLFRALCRMYEGKKTPEAIREFLAGKSKAEQAALRGNKHVAAIIDEIKAEDDKNGEPDTGSDDMLAELEGADAAGADADEPATAKPHRRAADKAAE